MGDVAKVIEVVGTSETGIEDAIRGAISRQAGGVIALRSEELLKCPQRMRHLPVSVRATPVAKTSKMDDVTRPAVPQQSQ